MKYTLSSGKSCVSSMTQVLWRFNIIYPSLRISFFRKLRCSKYVASLHAEFSQLSVQIRQVCEQTGWNICFLVHLASQSMLTTYIKKACKGDMSKFAWTSEPQISGNKTYYYSNSDYDVIKCVQCFCVVGGKLILPSVVLFLIFKFLSVLSRFWLYLDN